MGDPRKHRRKYSRPTQKWNKKRLDEEKSFIEEYGLKNKKEIMKIYSKVRAFAGQAKKLIRDRGKLQAQKEEKQLLEKLIKYGLLETDCKIEDVLGLSVNDLMERRLQTIVFKKGLAKGVKQARQFIVHGHIFVNGKKVDVPSYLVAVNEVDLIQFNSNSSLVKVEEVKEEVKKIKKEKVKEEVVEKTKLEVEKGDSVAKTNVEEKVSEVVNEGKEKVVA